MTASKPIPSLRSLIHAAGSTSDGSSTSPTSRLRASAAPHRVDLRDNDIGARGRCVQRGQRADRPGAGDEHGVAGRHPRGVDAVGRDGGGFDERALQVGDVVGQHADVGGGHDGELGDAAPAEAEADAGHRHAQVIQAAPAVVALAAEQQRHHRDALPDRDVGDFAADLDDLCRELVAEDLRQLRSVQPVRGRGDDDRAHRVLVQVGAADTAPAGPQQHLPRPRALRRVDVLDANVMGSVEDCCSHRKRLLCALGFG